MNCPTCKKHIPDFSTFCLHCGVRLQGTPQVSQELAQKSDHELLMLLVTEMQNIHLLLESGFQYSFSMTESRDGAWGANYSGSGSVSKNKR